MPHLTVPFRRGLPTLDAVVSLTAVMFKAEVASGISPPPLQHVLALVDTGASRTCVDPSIIRQLNLFPVASTEVFTAGSGSTRVTLLDYDISVMIPNARQGDLVIPVLRVHELELLESQGIHILIGRDILSRCLFVYNGNETTLTLAY